MVLAVYPHRTAFQPPGASVESRYLRPAWKSVMSNAPSFTSLLESDPALFDVRPTVPGPRGALPLTEDLLRHAPSGDLFGWSQNVGMGWKPGELGRQEVLLLSTSGGIRAPDGSPIALGYHTGHWEVGPLMQSAAEELRA